MGPKKEQREKEWVPQRARSAAHGRCGCNDIPCPIQRAMIRWFLELQWILAVHVVSQETVVSWISTVARAGPTGGGRGGSARLKKVHVTPAARTAQTPLTKFWCLAQRIFLERCGISWRYTPVTVRLHIFLTPIYKWAIAMSLWIWLVYTSILTENNLVVNTNKEICLVTDTSTSCNY